MTPEELASRLEVVLRLEFNDPQLEVFDLQSLTGGASRETWSFRAGEDRLVLQRARPGSPRAEAMADEAMLLKAAAQASVPVPSVVSASGSADALGASYLITRFVEGETIPRRILRDPPYAAARNRLAADCGWALAAIHSMPVDVVPGLQRRDELSECREVLDRLEDPHPTFEHAFRWLEANRPSSAGEALVHGDFRLGNLLVDRQGLRAVIDWELAHVGDPMEDLGWLCVRAWRFGGALPVAGVGSYEDLFGAYGASCGRTVDPEVVRWWEVLATLKWGIMCILQARSHLDGTVRSVELAAIGRRVCEQEHDLLMLLEPEALAMAAARPPARASVDPGLHGRPTMSELVDAVRGWVSTEVAESATGALAFESRVARNVLAVLQREATLGPAMEQAHDARLRALGVESDGELATRVRDGSLSGREVVRGISEAVVDKLRVANPRWFASVE